MLETIKQMLEADVEPFSDYYERFVESVQDKNIDAEISHLNMFTTDDIVNVEKLLNSQVKEVM